MLNGGHLRRDILVVPILIPGRGGSWLRGGLRLGLWLRF